MADLRIQSTEEMIGAGHATKADTLNRLALVEHGSDGVHGALTTAAPPTPAVNTPYKNTLVKAWGNISYSGGVPTLDDGVNISSIVDSGIGRVTFNFATAMADANYAVAGAPEANSSGYLHAVTQATGSVLTEVQNDTGAQDNPHSMMVVGNN